MKFITNILHCYIITSVTPKNAILLFIYIYIYIYYLSPTCFGIIVIFMELTAKLH